MSDSNQGLYSTETISTLMNISERRLEQLTKKKIIPKAGRGVYDLGSAVQAYIRYLQGLCSGAIKSGEPSELDKRLLEAKVLERESKARQAKYKADSMEQNLSEKSLRKAVKAIPELLAKKFESIDTEMIYALKNIIDEILNGCEGS